MRAHLPRTVWTHTPRSLVVLLVLAAMTSLPAMANLSANYTFASGTGTLTPIAVPNTAIAGTNAAAPGTGTFNELAVAGPFNIGFNFKFDCATYTQFSVNTGGLVTLGANTTNSYTNNLAGSPVYPAIAPFWDHQHLYNGGGSAASCNFTPLIGVLYATSGSAPNRVLTIEFNTQVYDNNNSAWWAGCGNTMNHYQVKLYEGTNKIEFVYGSMWANSGQPTSATIGIGGSTSDFVSVTPGVAPTTSALVSNNSIALDQTPITVGTVYSFTPCSFLLTGNGGFAPVGMAQGDSILNNQSVVLGNEVSYTGVYSVALPAGGCAARTYQMTIGGANAGDYRFASTNSQTMSGSQAAGTNTQVDLVFRPGALGYRPATLTFVDPASGCNASYVLNAAGAQRMTITGIIPQGGTATMANGDTLLNGKTVLVGTSANFTPLKVNNISTMNLAPAANVTYTITGGSGQYTIAPPSASVGSNASSTPTITFSPLINSSGPQPANLAVAVDGTTTNYVLNGFACAGASILQSPANQIACAETPTSFAVSATGTGTLNYQWRRNGTPIPGANSPVFNITSVRILDAGTYDVVVNGLCGGSVTSGQATLTVRNPAIIMQQPLDQSVTAGQNVTFSTQVTGTAPFSYQWFKDGVMIPGATSSSYTITSVKTTDLGGYSVSIANPCTPPYVVSNNAYLYIEGALAILKQPLNDTICGGGVAQFNSAASGASLHYQWFHNGVAVPGANRPDYSIGAAGVSDTGSYVLEVTNLAGNKVRSSPAMLVFRAPTSIMTQPSATMACAGSGTTFSVAADGSGLQYQWRKNGTAITGATSSTYTIGNTVASDTGRYDVVVTGICGEQSSNAATLGLNEVPTITQQPVGINVKKGAGFTLTVAATGTGLTYQWRKNGSNVINATQPTFPISFASITDAAQYDVIVGGTCQPPDTSAQVEVKVDTSSLGVDDLTVRAGEMLRVVPQPAHGITRLEVRLPDGIHGGDGAKLVIYDALGHQMIDVTDNFAAHGYAYAELNADAIVSGTYYCRLEKNGRIWNLGTVVVMK